MRNFVGRLNYLKRLEKLWGLKRSCLVSIYGRRRVGKTKLISEFAKGKKAWLFEAMEGEDTHSQIKHFLLQLSQFANEPYLKDLDYKEWTPVFEMFSQKLQKEKDIVVAFDELPWMSVRSPKLISNIKFYWDKKWKEHPHLMLILCGSIASWMVKRVVNSNALYGRISENILLPPLHPFEVAQFIGEKRGKDEILEYLLIFGGIPKYLEEMDFNKSIQINIDDLCFQPSGFFFDEAEKIFYNLFKETQLYKQITKMLIEGPLSLKEVAKKAKIKSGGGLKQYLDNLVYAGIVEKINDMKNFQPKMTFRYHMADEFLRFYYHFVLSNRKEIAESDWKSNFEKLTRGKWHPFMGLAFERFSLKHRYLIADVLGFFSKVKSCGPLLNVKENGYQYDLVYVRNDGVITLCEIKYLSEEASTSLIREMEEKLHKTEFPKNVTVEKILICNRDASKSLKESGYFHRILNAHEIIDWRGL